MATETSTSLRPAQLLRIPRSRGVSFGLKAMARQAGALLLIAVFQVLAYQSYTRSRWRISIMMGFRRLSFSAAAIMGASQFGNGEPDHNQMQPPKLRLLVLESCRLA